jgi:hypothetical protein
MKIIAKPNVWYNANTTPDQFAKQLLTKGSTLLNITAHNDAINIFEVIEMHKDIYDKLEAIFDES